MADSDQCDDGELLSTGQVRDEIEKDTGLAWSAAEIGVLSKLRGVSVAGGRFVWRREQYEALLDDLANVSEGDGDSDPELDEDDPNDESDPEVNDDDADGDE